MPYHALPSPAASWNLAAVNSSIKFLNNMMATEFRLRLTRHVHSLYLSNNQFYHTALNPSSDLLDNIDQRVVDDVSEFAHEFANLYSSCPRLYLSLQDMPAPIVLTPAVPVPRSFKPLLDVIFFTYAAGRKTGVLGPVLLYSYFVAAGFLMRALSPPFALYKALNQQLEGDLRHGHSRLVAHAEEVAFLGGGPKEKQLLDESLGHLTSFGFAQNLLHLATNMRDQYVLKYLSNIVGYPILAVPFMLRNDLSPGQLIAEFKEADWLLTQARLAAASRAQSGA
eukprot:gene7713-1381_t